MRKLIGLVAVGVLLCASASADVVIGNFSAGVGTGTAFGPGSTTVFKAFGWTMPAGQDYFLDEVVLSMDFDGTGLAEVSIWNGANTPQNKLTSLQSPNLFGTGDFSFTPTTQFIMEAGKNYWAYVEALPGTSAFRWDGTSPSTMPSGLASAIGYIFNGNPSSYYNRLEVRGTVVPEPATLTLLALAGLILRRR